MPEAPHQDLRYEVDGAIATITLDRQERMNAFTFDMMDRWAQVLREAQADDKVRVVIVTGAGAAFCAGGDIVQMKERFEQTPLQRKEELWKRVQRVPLTLEDFDKPVIAAINGAATGAGLDVALACDIRYAAESARLGETYVKVALVPGAGGAHFLPRIVGPARALEMFLTGDLMDAHEAERIGLVNKVFKDGEFRAEVQSRAEKIAKAPPVTARFLKRALAQGMRNDLRTNLDLISSHYAVVTSMQDHREAVEAFLEKRQPKFEGR